MSDRDELAEVMARHRIDPNFKCTCGEDFFPEEREEELDEDENAFLAAFEAHQSEAILATGYRKHRMVTTLDELKTVYEGALLKDAEGEMWGIDGSTGRLFLVGDGNYDLYGDEDLNLPATVVYEEPETGTSGVGSVLP